MLILYWLKKSLVIRKAIAIQKVCREIPIGLKDYELIVGIPTMSSVGFGQMFLLSFLVTINMDESLRKALFGLILILLLVIYSRSTKSDQG